jgi:serine/threonine protein kinase
MGEGNTDRKRKQVVFRLLEAVFSGNEFDNFLARHFPEIEAETPPGLTTSHKMQMLIDYCARQGKIKTLLDQIEKAKPESYRKFVKGIKEPDKLDLPSPRRARLDRSLRTESEIIDTQSNLLHDQEIASRYRFEEVLNRSGLGAVFKAYDTKLDIPVAIKVIDLERVDQLAARERVKKEVQTAIKLDHPSVVKIYDFGEVGSLFYIVMEFISGYNLDQARQLFKHADLIQLLQIGREICLTVDYMHHHGVLHPGTKPENIMLKPGLEGSKAWTPVIINLGLLRPNREVLASGNISSRRLVYLVSPELLLGHNTDIRSDVYALGLTLYDMLVGQPPFWPPNLEEARRLHVETPVPPPQQLNPKLPEPVAQVLLQALAKDPADRFLNAKGMAQALERCIEGLSLPDGVGVARPPALPLTHVDLMMDTQPMVVEPGDTATLRVKLWNRGTQDDQRQIRLDGLPPEWVTISPSTTMLRPGAKEEIEIRVQPTRLPQSKAGRRAVTIQAVNNSDPDQFAEVKTVVTVAPFYQFESRMYPQELSGEQTTQITVENLGNTVTTFKTHAKDDRFLKFQPEQHQLKLEPGASGAVEIHVSPRRRYFVGDSITRTFAVEVTTSNNQTATHPGQFTASGRLPLRWALVLLVTVMLCVLASLLLYTQTPALQQLTLYQAGAQQVSLTVTAEARATASQATAAAQFLATATWEVQDSDRDGLTNAEEVKLNTDPSQADTDGDGLSDGVEAKELPTNPLERDSDSDGILDGVEYQEMLDPTSRDSDGDGIPDSRDQSPNATSTPVPAPGQATPPPVAVTLNAGFVSNQTYLRRASLFSDNYRVLEGQGRVPIEVGLSQASPRELTVDYYLLSTNATPGTDFVFNNGSVTFLPNQTLATFDISFPDSDTTARPTRLVSLGLRNPPDGVRLGTQQIRIEIVDND